MRTLLRGTVGFSALGALVAAFAIAAPVDNAVTIAASGSTVTFGKTVAITGAVTGPSNTGLSVTLEQNPAPYTGGFKPTGLTTPTDASGGYSFTVAPALNTRYRVVAKAKKRPTSPELAINVRVKVSLGLSDRTPRKGQRVRFSGSVLPAHDGTLASIQRHTSAGWRTVATTPLVTATAVNGVARSTFAKRLRIRHTGTYRVSVLPTDGDHVAGNSPRRTARVH